MEAGSGQTFQNCWQEKGENVCGPEMVILPKAGFQMGSSLAEINALTKQYGDHFKTEAPKHEVSISEPFAVSRFEVTFDDWRTCVKGGGCQHNGTPSDRGWGRGKRPAINISWNDAQDYGDWLNSKVGGKPYRLLSEAEWEYAARASTTTRYFWGDDIGNGNANCQSCGSQWDNKQTAPVGSFKPNGWGLYDMHGNVWEWVQDCYADSYQETPRDGRPAKTTENCPRIVRGGSSDFYPWGLRSAYRYRYVPDFRYDDVGFRVARTLTP
jgi:formylglycine-generating enzyme required for sulfatase activity